MAPFALPTSVFPQKSMCSNKTVRPATQTCIKSLNCQTGKHRLTPANRSRTHRQGAGQSMLFINNLQEGIHPPHTLSCDPSVNSPGKRCLLSYPILHFRELPNNLEKQFNTENFLNSLISYFLQWMWYKTTKSSLQGVSKTLSFSPTGQIIS